MTSATTASASQNSVLESVFLDLVVDRLQGKLQQLRRLRLVPAGELECLLDETALDVRQGRAHGNLDDGRLLPADAAPGPGAREEGKHDRRADRRTVGEGC